MLKECKDFVFHRYICIFVNDFTDKNPMGILSTTTSKQKERLVYNLSGQKLTSPQDGVKPTKGVYIQDGKIVVVK